MSYQLGATEVQTGSTGPDVIQVQTLLTQRGYSPGPLDGVFGPDTKTAVSRFQSDRGLTIDGIVGPNTWAALTGASAGVPVPAALPAPSVSPAPTSLVLSPGSRMQLIAGASPLTLILGGLGVLALVTMSGRKAGKGRKRRR
jgi:peptidoglycan hydrolase-like protein with peptidoglycan-binding domain